MKKRVVSLLLALGCALSLSVPAFAADASTFTDAKDIKHWEAVAALAQLGVIDGEAGGSFTPTRPVTRAEVSRMMVRISDSGEPLDPADTEDRPPIFSDIAGHWAKLDMEICSRSLFGLDGREDGTFDPDGEVSCVEVAKVALRLLGYDGETYGLTGPDWALSTNAIANQTSVRLYDGVTVEDPNSPATRETAARIFYNALKVQVIRNELRVKETETGFEPVFVPVSQTDKNGEPVSLLEDKWGIKQIDSLPAQPES